MSVRVRIVKRMAGILDGQSLSAFVPDVVYEVDEHLGIQLIALYGAVEDDSTAPAVSLDTLDNAGDELPPMIEGGVHLLYRERRQKPR